MSHVVIFAFQTIVNRRLSISLIPILIITSPTVALKNMASHWILTRRHHHSHHILHSKIKWPGHRQPLHPIFKCNNSFNSISLHPISCNSYFVIIPTTCNNCKIKLVEVVAHHLHHRYRRHLVKIPRHFPAMAAKSNWSSWWTICKNSYIWICSSSQIFWVQRLEARKNRKCSTLLSYNSIRSFCNKCSKFKGNIWCNKGWMYPLIFLVNVQVSLRGFTADKKTFN